MKARNEKPVVIAGGGIGGLAAALALARKGFRSVVLEQAPQFGEIGAGIQLAPNAWHALDALGVGGLVKKEAVFIQHLLMMDGVSGEKVIDIPLDERFARRFGNPYAVTHRADIHGSLLDGCKALPKLIELRTSTKVTGFYLEDSGVTVKTDKGPIHGEALVGADGGRSVIRQSIVGDPLPPVSGHMCYRAVLRPEDMPKDLRWAAATLWAAHNTHIVHYPLRGWKLFNLVATVIGKHTSGGHNELAQPDEVLPLFAHYCEKPTKLMRAPKEFRRWMLAYREPVDNWSRGRVTLLGDAAHFMLQYMAQGAAMAMEDAVCLGACADAADGQFERAFLEYQEKRIVRATRVQISANQLVGMIFHVPDGLEREVRNDIYRGRPAERYYDALEWIFSAPEYVRDFRKKAGPGRSPRPNAPRIAASRAPARSTGSRARAARPARRPPSRRTASRVR
ncbi:MAG TPA: 3-hydroxybenzoate 6-monooxygenase [Burkholderiales bacterium]|nr:3-hydroxybenzoate 6-monooxygenase [Burkholderiales bacterium]